MPMPRDAQFLRGRSMRRVRVPSLVALMSLALLAAAPALGAEEARKSGENPHGPNIGECSLCHKADSWVPAYISPKFDHSRFGFPLDGAHAKTPCRGCHTSLNFSEAKPSTDCVSCHSDVHQGELGAACGRCHSPRSFIDRSRMARAHQATRFPLVGSHLVADCEACHLPAPQGHLTYVNVSTECQACHLAAYQATTSPNHLTVGFSTDCAQCHTPIAWRVARFTQHDIFYFPIYSGAHRGKWDTCSDCHINPQDNAQFSCFAGCHAHDDPVQMASKHAGVSGYTYDSQACYGCHPNGRTP